MSAQSVAAKLRIRPDARLWASHRERAELLAPLPDGVSLVDDAGDADAGVLFADDAASLRELAARHGERLRDLEPLWVAYPKSNRTDINRDSLWPILADHGLRPIGQVALDATWSALRFRPLKPGEELKGGAKS
jgi:hypothetical protein